LIHVDNPFDNPEVWAQANVAILEALGADEMRRRLRRRGQTEEQIDKIISDAEQLAAESKAGD
jgi:hypothetical protein